MLFMVYPQMIPSKGQNAGEGGPARMGMGISALPPSAAGLGFTSARAAAAAAAASGAGGSVGSGSGGAGAGSIGGGGGGAEGSPAAVGSVSTAAVALKAERFEPRMYGFRVHEEARLSRWRSARRDA